MISRLLRAAPVGVIITYSSARFSSNQTVSPVHVATAISRSSFRTVSAVSPSAAHVNITRVRAASDRIAVEPKRRGGGNQALTPDCNEGDAGTCLRYISSA
jgi:hypothetical protein